MPNLNHANRSTMDLCTVRENGGRAWWGYPHHAWLPARRSYGQIIALIRGQTEGGEPVLNHVLLVLPPRFVFRVLLAVLLISTVLFALLVLPGAGSSRAAVPRLPEVPPGVITGLVWHDFDLDLFPDAGEPPLAGVTVLLQDENRVLLSSRITDNEGQYTFSDLGSATYWVIENDPPGFISTTDNEVRVQLIGNQGAEVNFGDVLPVTDTPTPVGPPVVRQVTIQASLDDTYVPGDQGSNAVTDPVIRLGRAPAANVDAGLRFQQIGIPPGARIDEARLRLYATVAHGGGLPVEIVVMGEAADAAANFASSNPLVPLRPRTQAAVDWVVTTWPGGWFESPNLSGPLQEIIDRPGWAAGNPLVLLLLSQQSNTGYLDASAWDGSTALAAQLHVTFHPPAGWATPTPTPTPPTSTWQHYLPFVTR